jgi:hypothetical protein
MGAGSSPHGVDVFDTLRKLRLRRVHPSQEQYGDDESGTRQSEGTMSFHLIRDFQFALPEHTRIYYARASLLSAVLWNRRASSALNPEP